MRETVDTSTDRHFDDVDLTDPANVMVVKEISLREKIAFWNKVFHHADARGIDIIVFHWNMYVFGAKAKHGMTDDMIMDWQEIFNDVKNEVEAVRKE